MNAGAGEAQLPRGQAVGALSSLATPARRRAIRHGLILGGVLAAAIAGFQAYQGPAIDAYAYWSNRPPVQYVAAPGTDGAFLYSPAFAQVLSPLTALPWQVFLAVWLVAMLVTLGWLTGPLLLLPIVLLTGNEIYYGNVHFFIAAAMVLGFRYPAAWALPLLTKVTPGVGLAWFAVRREWRKLLIAMAATALIIAVSFALDPDGWRGWIQLLAAGASGGGHPTLVPGPLWLRIVAAVAIVAWGALTDRKWAVPIAAVVALPHGTIGLALLVAVIPLLDKPSLRPGWRAALAWAR
jgi:hypothetical protein